MSTTPLITWAPPLPSISALRQRCPDVAPVTPRQITFDYPRSPADPPPRVGIEPPPRVAIVPAVPLTSALPPRIPIAHRTRYRTTADLALFAGEPPIFRGYVPTSKASPLPMGFAGLCRAHAMTCHRRRSTLCLPLPRPVHLRPFYRRILGTSPTPPPSEVQTNLGHILCK